MNQVIRTSANHRIFKMICSLSVLLIIIPPPVLSTEEPVDETWEMVSQCKQQYSYVLRAGFFPDGQKLWMVSSIGAAGIWNTQTGERLIFLQERETRFLDACVSRDGKTLFTIDSKTTLNIHDAATGELLESHDLPKNSGDRILLSGSTDRLVIGDSVISVWMATPPYKQVATLGSEIQGLPSCVAVSPDGKLVGVSMTGGVFAVWSLPRTKLLLQGKVDWPKPETLQVKDRISRIAFSPDGKRVAVSYEVAMETWDLSAKKRIVSWRTSGGYINSISWFQDSMKLAATCSDDDTEVFDAKTGKNAAPFTFTAAEKGALLAKWGELGRWFHENADGISFTFSETKSADVSPDGSVLALTGEDNTVLVDTKTGEPLQVLPRDSSLFKGTFAQAPPHTVFSADGKYLLSTGRKPVVWKRK